MEEWEINMDIGLAILIGIALLLIMIYLSTHAIVGLLNHWGKKNDEAQESITEMLNLMYEHQRRK